MIGDLTSRELILASVVFLSASLLVMAIGGIACLILSKMHYYLEMNRLYFLRVRNVHMAAARQLSMILQEQETCESSVRHQIELARRANATARMMKPSDDWRTLVAQYISTIL